MSVKFDVTMSDAPDIEMFDVAPTHARPVRLLDLPPDVHEAIFDALLGAPCARTGGVAVGDSIRVSGALALADTHPRFARALRTRLSHIALGVGGGPAEREAQRLLAHTQGRARRLSLSGAHALPRTLMSALPGSGLRALDVRALPAVPDRTWARIINAHKDTLQMLRVAGAHGFGPAAAGAAANAAGLCELSVVNARELPAMALDALLERRGNGLRKLELRLRYACAEKVAARCGRLVLLVLEAENDGDDVLRAAEANKESLEVLRAPGALLRATHVTGIVRACGKLSELTLKGLSHKLVAEVVRHRAVVLSLRSPNVGDVNMLAAACTKVRELDWEGGGVEVLEEVVKLVKTRGGALQSLRLAGLPVDDEAMRRIGEAAGMLRSVRLDALEHVSASGVEALVRANAGTLTDVAIGAKCRRLSNVSLMDVLGAHCARLRVVSFPRWGAVRRVPAERRLLAAVDDFHRRAPLATIVAE